MKVLVDYHHTSLLRSLNLLFKRLEMDVYRPIGMDWYDRGYWAINKLEDTAKQFLQFDSQPIDNTPALNDWRHNGQAGVYKIIDPGGLSHHMACKLEYFQNTDFDFVIASIPQHVEPFKKLIKDYNPRAKLIIQMGNNWQGYDFGDTPVLASVAGPLPHAGNVMYYHQEFDTGLFMPTDTEPTKKIMSFVNVLEHTGQGWADFTDLERILKPEGFELFSYGGQCRDGNMTGPLELADKMREAEFILHSKPGGDGYGHIIHNAYCVGRPLILRPGQYHNQLAEQLMIPGTFIDLDRYGPEEVKNIVIRLTNNPHELRQMGRAAAKRFKEVVDFGREAGEIREWLENLIL